MNAPAPRRLVALLALAGALLAALPTGSNALIFAQRYRTMETEVTAATVLSTVLYVATAPLWLALLAWLSPW